ncbi:MAG: DinB family protein [Bryobacteraceae bacterium]
MSETQRIADQLRRAFGGDAWHGPSVEETLQGVHADMAFAKPIPAAHSIWEIVLHLDAWHRAVRRRLEGEAVELTDEQDWPPVEISSREDWQTALQSLRRGYEELLKVVGDLSDERLAAKAPGRDHSVYHMVHGLIQHDLYHAGQIAILRRG